MSYQHYQCDPNIVDSSTTPQGRGVTTWNLGDQYTVPLLGPGGAATYSFTCTVPKCYSSGNTANVNGTIQPIQGRDSCNLVFNAWSNDGKNSDNSLSFNLNGNNLGGQGINISGVATHGATQAFDIGNAILYNIYNDMGPNTFIVKNTSSSSTIHLEHFKVYRTYQMCNLYVEQQYGCNTSGMCESGSNPGSGGSLDSSRADTPCNNTSCGGLSFTQFHDSNWANKTIAPNGGTLSSSFNFSGAYSGGNYVGKSICLCNFNKIWSSGTVNSDVPVVALINGWTMDTYYVSRIANHVMFPSHDLTQNIYYNDTGSNIVTLKNTGGATIYTSSDGLDIYRIFQTSRVC